MKYLKLNIVACTRLDEAVEKLLEYNRLGMKVYCDFNGHILYSDKVTMDSAYLEVCGKTKKECDEETRKIIESANKEKEETKLREERYKEKVAKANNNQPVEITMEKVIIGLIFIAEHRDMPQEELLDSLLELGVTFTFDDMDRYMKEHNLKPKSIFKSMIDGDLIAGASVICNMRDSEFGRSFGDDRFLSVDDESSIYAYIRKNTDLKDFTKENIENKPKKRIK